MGFDQELLVWINQAWADPGLDLLMAWFSSRPGFSAPLMLILLLYLWPRFGGDGLRLWLLLLATIVLSDMLGNLLKELFAQPRPCFEIPELLRPPGGGPARACDAPQTGMPSNHTLNFFAVAVFLSYTVRRLPLSLWMFCIAVLVSLSRIYLAKHYPSQVLAGAVIGSGFGLLLAWSGTHAFGISPGLQESGAGRGNLGDGLVGWLSNVPDRLMQPPVGRVAADFKFTRPLVWLPLALCLFAGILVWIMDWNQPLFLVLNGLGASTGDSLWAGLTLLGDTLVALVLASLLLRRRSDIVGVLLLSALITTLYVHGLKPIFDLPRPLAILGADQVHVIGAALRQHSFPSGHTATIFTLLGVIILRGVHPALAIPLFILAIVVGLSRSMVGAHWPLDILAGAFGGWLSAVLAQWLSRYWRLAYKPWMGWLLGLLFLGCSLALLTARNLGYPQALGLQMGVGLIGLYCSLRFLWGLWDSRS